MKPSELIKHYKCIPQREPWMDDAIKELSALTDGEYEVIPTDNRITGMDNYGNVTMVVSQYAIIKKENGQ